MRKNPNFLEGPSVTVRVGLKIFKPQGRIPGVFYVRVAE